MNQLKTVTYEQFLGFDPCWLEDEDKTAKLERIASRKAEWAALDVLALEDVEAKDKLWAVLREDFIDAPILHKFACRCAERALSKVKNPDPRSVAAIAAKWAWLSGEITDAELATARAAAWAATRDATRDAAWVAAWAAAGAARDAARDAASVAAGAAAQAAASDAAQAAAWDAAYDTECDWQVSMLIEMLGEDA